MEETQTPEEGAPGAASSPDAAADVETGAHDPASLGAPDAAAAPAKRGSFFKELPVLVILAFALAILVKTFLLQAFYIPSESMVPTLEVGDRVLVNKMVYHFHEPRRGDIIVFIAHHGEHKSFFQRVRSILFEGLGVTRPADVDFIKRVIGLPGETLKIDHGRVTITPKGGGKPFTLTEPYLSPIKDESSFGPVVVKTGTFFVMGDNRTNSADSRTELGAIARGEIVGRAFVRIWPAGRFGLFHRPHYSAAGYPRSRGTGWETRAAAA
jgi:signal peptidase I